MNWSGTDSGWPTAAPADLPAAVAVARDRAEEILRRAVEHYTRTAPPPLDVHQPGPAADLLTALGRDLRKYGVGVPH
ncbi:hypothetical protein, partial [Corynebacterium bovis]